MVVMANGAPRGNGRRTRAAVNGAGRGVDLSALGMTDDEAREVQEQLEHQLGGRCNGCGRRITLGFKFTSIDVRHPRMPVVQLSACTRDDCDYAEQCRDGATFIEQVEFAWLDGNGKDAPASLAVVRRNEEIARRAAAAAAESDSGSDTASG